MLQGKPDGKPEASGTPHGQTFGKPDGLGKAAAGAGDAAHHSKGAAAGEAKTKAHPHAMDTTDGEGGETKTAPKSPKSTAATAHGVKRKADEMAQAADLRKAALRGVERKQWEEMLDLVRCQVPLLFAVPPSLVALLPSSTCLGSCSLSSLFYLQVLSVTSNESFDAFVLRCVCPIPACRVLPVIRSRPRFS